MYLPGVGILNIANNVRTAEFGFYLGRRTRVELHDIPGRSEVCAQIFSFTDAPSIDVSLVGTKPKVPLD